MITTVLQKSIVNKTGITRLTDDLTDNMFPDLHTKVLFSAFSP
jgi:hypothetical protein